MAPAAILTGKWATAEDTAAELGVSARRLKQLKKLAAELLGPKKRSQRTGNGRLGSSHKKTAAASGTAKSAKQAKKNTQNAHTSIGAVKRSKSS